MNAKKRCFICKEYAENEILLKTNYGYAHKTCLFGSNSSPVKKKTSKTSKVSSKAKKRLKNEDMSVPQLKKTLTRWFNEFIRLRDTDENGNGKCISCGRVIVFGTAKCHAGHFIPSTYSATKFDELNVNGQCSHCNLYKSANLTEYEENLLKKIGKDAVELLKIKKHNKVKWHKFELIEMIKEYKIKVKELRKTKEI